MKEMKLDYEALPYGAMVWWEKCEDAFSYSILLCIVDDDGASHEICYITKDRNTTYHSFVDLGINRNGYTVKVQAENREGDVICEHMVSFRVSGIVTVRQRPY